MKRTGYALRCTSLALFLLVLLFPFAALAKPGSDIHWQVEGTSHFRIHYSATQRAFVDALAPRLERAYEWVSHDLRWHPREAIDVVVNPDTDVAGAWTEIFPSNRLEITVVPPAAGTAEGESDDWLQSVCVHELMHLVAGDQTRGVFEWARWVFGAVAKANAYLPPWLTEGVAVYEESRRGRGRGQSALLNAVLREAASNGLSAYPIDRLSDPSPSRWPGAYTPYWFGYALAQTAAQTAGGRAIPKLLSETAGRVPFWLEPPSRATLGDDFPTLWSRTVARLSAAAAEDLETFARTSATQARTLARVGRMSGGAVASPDGEKVYLVRDTIREGVGLSVWNSGDPGRNVLALSEWRYGGFASLRIDSTGKWLLYSRLELADPDHLSSDLFAWSLERNREYRLTQAARARDPDFSPDVVFEGGRLVRGRLAYIQTRPDSRQALVLRDERGQERVLHSASVLERLSTPRWGRGNFAEWIVFTSKAPGEPERLVAVHERTGHSVSLAAGPSLWHPEWLPSGDLVVSGSKSGIFNLYRLSAESVSRLLSGKNATPAALVAVTNLRSPALYPAYWPGRPELLAMLYGVEGFDLVALPPAPNAADLPVLSPLLDRSPVLEREARAAAGDRPESDPLPTIPSLVPRYWLPFVEKKNDGWALGAGTSGTDALGLHHYSVAAAWDSRARFPLYHFDYRYEGLYPSLQFDRTQENRYIGWLGTSNRVATTSVATVYPIGFWSVRFGGSYYESSLGNQSRGSGGLEASFGWNNQRRFEDSIDEGGERGLNTSLGFTGYLLGDEQFSAIDFSADARLPIFGRRDFARFALSASRSDNSDLSSLYYVGGGESAVWRAQSYLIRGFVPGVVYGRSIATMSLEYWLPVLDVFRGWRTFPVFYEKAKLRAFVDTGSGEFVGNHAGAFSAWPVGIGVHLLQDLKLFYRWPITVALGVDQGLSSRLGGGTQFVGGFYGRL